MTICAAWRDLWDIARAFAQRTCFENMVLDVMLVTFVDTGDREGLVRLLSTRFRDVIGYDTPIELCLVGSPEHRLKDPILVLGEAYSKCQDPEVRHHLAIVVRRAFVGSGIEGKDDGEFVENAMQWFKDHKANLVLTQKRYARQSFDYFPVAYEKVSGSRPPADFDPSHPWPEYEENPLFVEKSPVPKKKKEKEKVTATKSGDSE